MANLLTAARILCALLRLLFPAFSKGYYICYLLGGLTDAADGAAARMLGTATAFGAKIDTAADIVLALAVLWKIVVSVAVPPWLLLWAGMIALIKAANIAVGFVRCHPSVCHRAFAAEQGLRRGRVYPSAVYRRRICAAGKGAGRYPCVRHRKRCRELGERLHSAKRYGRVTGLPPLRGGAGRRGVYCAALP